MHETSIVLSIISIVEDEARKRRVSRINTVTLCVGELASIEENTLRGCFEIAVENSMLAEAELVIEPVEAVFSCNCCGVTVTGRSGPDSCPGCQCSSLNLKQGRELYVKSFEAD